MNVLASMMRSLLWIIASGHTVGIVSFSILHEPYMFAIAAAQGQLFLTIGVKLFQ